MVENKNGLSLELIIHPGETLKEVLEDRHMTQKELSVRTGVTEAHVSQLIKGQKNISVSYAKKLSYALDIPASFWINLQSNYDKEKDDFEEVNNILQEELDLLQKLKDIIDYAKKLGFLPENSYDSKLVINLRQLLNISNLLSIPDLAELGSYRLAKGVNIDPFVMFTWLRLSDLVSKGQRASNSLDVGKIVEVIPEIKRLMFKDYKTIVAELQESLLECGVVFSVVESFRGAPVQGVIKKNNDGTINLTMTNRYKFADIFWFTFFHEIGHIINGDVDDRLIDYENVETEKETKANEFSAEILIPSKFYEAFIQKRDFSSSSIERAARELEIPTFILIGRLQRDRYLQHYEYSDQKIRYK
jgi:HTH-type transcriptional regulator/antitoxin HigA